MAGRPYTMKEMKGIVQFIKDHNAYGETKGRKFWMDFAGTALTERTWQSLKETFLKRVLPDIHNPYYNLTQDEIYSFRTGVNHTKHKTSNKLEFRSNSESSNSNDKQNENSTASSKTNGMQISAGEDNNISTQKVSSNRDSVETLILDTNEEAAIKKLEGYSEASPKKSKSLRDCIQYLEPLTPLMHNIDSDDEIPLVIDEEAVKENRNIVTNTDTQAGFSKSQHKEANKDANVQDIDKTKKDSKFKEKVNKKYTKKRSPKKKQKNDSGDTSDTTEEWFVKSAPHTKGSKSPLLNKKSQVPNEQNSSKPTNESSSIVDTLLPNNQEVLQGTQQSQSILKDTLSIPCAQKFTEAQTTSNTNTSKKEESKITNEKEPTNKENIDKQPSTTEANLTQNSETSQNNSQIINPCLQTVNLFEQILTANTDSDSTTDDTSKPNEATKSKVSTKDTIETIIQKNKIVTSSLPSGQILSEQTEVGLVVLNSHSDSDTDCTNNAHKSQNRAHQKGLKRKFINNLFGNKSGLGKKMQRNNYTKKTVHYSDSSSDSESEIGSGSDAEYISQPCTCKKIAKNYMKPKGLRVLSLEEGGLFVANGRKVYPLVKNGKKIKNVVISSGSESEEDSYWKIKYVEERKKNMEMQKMLENRKEHEQLQLSAEKLDSPILPTKMPRKNESRIEEHIKGNEIVPVNVTNNDDGKEMLKIKIVKNDKEVSVEGHWQNIHNILPEMMQALQNNLATPEARRLPSVLTESDEDVQKKIDTIESTIFKEINESAKEEKAKPKRVNKKPEKNEVAKQGKANNDKPLEDKTKKQEKGQNGKQEKDHIDEVVGKDQNENMEPNNEQKNQLDEGPETNTNVTERTTRRRKVNTLSLQRKSRTSVSEDAIKKDDKEPKRKSPRKDKTEEIDNAVEKDKGAKKKSSRKDKVLEDNEIQKDDTETERKSSSIEKAEESDVEIIVDEKRLKPVKDDDPDLERSLRALDEATAANKSSNRPGRPKKTTRESKTELKAIDDDSIVTLYKFPSPTREDQPVKKKDKKSPNKSRNAQVKSSQESATRITVVITNTESSQGYQDSDASPIKTMQKKRCSSAPIYSSRKQPCHRYSKHKSYSYNICEASNESSNSSFHKQIKDSFKTSEANSSAYRSESYQLLLPKRDVNAFHNITKTSPCPNEVDSHCSNSLNLSPVSQNISPSLESEMSIELPTTAANSSNVSLPMSPEISVVENIAISKISLPSTGEYHQSINEVHSSEINEQMNDVDQLTISHMDVSIPLMEQDLELKASEMSLDTNKNTSTLMESTKHAAISDSLLDKIHTVNIENNQTISDSLDMRLTNLLLESAKKITDSNKKSSKYNKENIRNKSNQRKRCSTPHKKSVKGTSQITIIEEEQMEFCRSLEKISSSAHTMDFCALAPDFGDIDIVEPDTTIKTKKKTKNVIKVKILRPQKDKLTVKKRKRKTSAHTDSGINDTTTSAILKTLDETVALKHNHSETCLQTHECLSNSIEFVDNSNTSVLSVDSSGTHSQCIADDIRRSRTPELFSTDAQHATYLSERPRNFAKVSQLSSSLLTEDLSDEVRELPSSDWYLCSEEEDTSPKDLRPSNCAMSGSYGSNLEKLFPITCAVPDLSTITEQSRDTDVNTRKSLAFNVDSNTRQNLEHEFEQDFNDFCNN